MHRNFSLKLMGDKSPGSRACEDPHLPEQNYCCRLPVCNGKCGTHIWLGQKGLKSYLHLQDLLPALKSLGMNTMEQEVIDLTNTVARNGLIFFPEFCEIVLKRFREDDEAQFAQVMFKVHNKQLGFKMFTFLDFQMLRFFKFVNLLIC